MPSRTEPQPVVALMDGESDELSLARIGADSLLGAIVQAARDPKVDAAKISALLDIKVRIEAIESENAYWSAMKLCQDDMEPIRKDAKNPETHSKFAKVSTVQKATQPIYRKHGFCLTFTADDADVTVVPLVCIVSHEAGHRQKYRLKATIDDKGPKGGAVKTPVQGTVSTSSYLRRKLYELIFDLILTDDDDDGNLGKRITPITPEQADTINTMLNDCGMTDKAKRAGFYAWAEISNVAELPAHKYEKAVVMLQSKARQMK